MRFRVVKLKPYEFKFAIIKSCERQSNALEKSVIEQSRTFVFLLWHSRFYSIFVLFIYFQTSYSPSKQCWHGQILGHLFLHASVQTCSQHNIVWRKGQKNVLQTQTWICETCWILCCKTGFFSKTMSIPEYICLFIFIQDCNTWKRAFLWKGYPFEINLDHFSKRFAVQLTFSVALFPTLILPKYLIYKQHSKNGKFDSDFLKVTFLLHSKNCSLISAKKIHNIVCIIDSIIEQHRFW